MLMPRQPVVGRTLGLLALVAAVLAMPLAAQAPSTEGLWQAFWQADSPREAAKEADKLIKAGVEFDAAWAQLKRGRSYGKAPTGERALRATAQGGMAFDNYIDVPADYDPGRPWPVRVQLHGGVDRQDPEEGRKRRENRIRGEPQIYVHPFGWADAAWWHGPQVDNILSLVDRVKRRVQRGRIPDLI